RRLLRRLLHLARAGSLLGEGGAERRCARRGELGPLAVDCPRFRGRLTACALSSAVSIWCPRQRGHFSCREVPGDASPNGYWIEDDQMIVRLGNEIDELEARSSRPEATRGPSASVNGRSQNTKNRNARSAKRGAQGGDREVGT